VACSNAANLKDPTSAAMIAMRPVIELTGFLTGRAYVVLASNAQVEVAVDWYVAASFLMATLFLLITPGPVMAIVAHNTLRNGATGGLMTAIGIELGEVCLLGVTFAGLMISGELLPALFRWISLAGALYLVWLAVSTLRSRYMPSRSARLTGSSKPILDGLTVAFGNPTALVFYAAFFPQFINFDHAIPQQILQLGTLYLCAALLFDLTCVLVFTCIRLPASLARFAGFAELGSVAVYLTIATVTVVGFMKASN
jgi:threonine/homoserine/homoserine lactone efflux protein